MTIYMPPHFRLEDEARLVELIERHAFGTLVSSGPAGLQVSHIPFVPERGADDKLRLHGHVARANDQWQSLEGAAEVLAIFHGPHAYVSPGWYQQHPSVPTWNYAVVHAHCKARLMDEAELLDLLYRLSTIYESGRPKPWRLADLPADFVSNMLKAIVGFELDVVRLEGKFKLSQNRPAEIPRVIEALRQEAPDVAELMAALVAAPTKGKIPS
jgi:transcriptional regulator